MNKLVFIEQELNEGINTVDVAFIKPNSVKPPKNAFVMCDFDLLSYEDACENEVKKYQVEVNVTKDEFGEISSITLASTSLIEKSKAIIEADPKYTEELKKKRAEEYKKEVDSLNFELVEMLADAVITNKIVIDGDEAKALAQSIKDKKQAIKDKIK